MTLQVNGDVGMVVPRRVYNDGTTCHWHPNKDKYWWWFRDAAFKVQRIYE